MDCEKYIKKAKIGFILILLIFPVVTFKDIIGYGLLLKTVSIIYIIAAWIVGLALVLPYIRCIVDYNRSHKPPHSK